MSFVGDLALPQAAGIAGALVSVGRSACGEPVLGDTGRSAFRAGNKVIWWVRPFCDKVWVCFCALTVTVHGNACQP